MGTAEKIAMGIIGIGMATTLILPDRQTPAVINALTSLFRGSLATAMALLLPRRRVPDRGRPGTLLDRVPHLVVHR